MWSFFPDPTALHQDFNTTPYVFRGEIGAESISEDDARHMI
jgi:hypothetical protein